MPKNLNYPLASFQKAFELAEAVDALGGSCSVENCATKLNRKISGGFMVVISSAQKFSLVRNEKSLIIITEEYKLIKHSYTNTERLELLRKAFLSPQVFFILHNRFLDKELPIGMLDKILIREFGVEENTANRIVGYFVEGLKTYGLINSANIVQRSEENQIENKAILTDNTDQIIESENIEKPKVENVNPNASFTDTNLANYELQLSGPGINTTITVKDEDDISIVEAILKKLKNKISFK